MVSSSEDKRAEMSSFLFPQALKWQLSPLTIVSWLNVYMQVAYLNDMYEVLLPQYPQHVFIQIAEVGAAAWGACPPTPGPRPPVARRGVWPPAQCSLPAAPGPLRAGRGLLRVPLRRPGRVRPVPLLLLRADAEGLRCASPRALAGRTGQPRPGRLTCHVSSAGYQWCDIEKCVKWMVPFAMVIREAGSSKLKQFRGVPPEDAHNIQTHLNSLDLLVSRPPFPPDEGVAWQALR